MSDSKFIKMVGLHHIPNALERDKILNGGPYLILGRHLVLKALPSCFLFKAEDMNYIPTSVKVFGLPAECWTKKVLSRLASVIGKPIYTDKLTQSKQRTTSARILIEVDATKPRVDELNVKLPTKEYTKLEFTYEYEAKYCMDCKTLGDSTGWCDVTNAKANKENLDKRMNGNRMRSISQNRWGNTYQRGRSLNHKARDSAKAQEGH